MQLIIFFLSSLAVNLCNALNDNLDDKNDQTSFLSKIPDNVIIMGSNAAAMGSGLNPWIAGVTIISTNVIRYKLAGLNLLDALIFLLVCFWMANSRY